MDRHNVTQLDGLFERDIIHCRRHTDPSAATMRADRCIDVHPIEQVTPHQITKGIRVIGHDNACAGGVRFFRGALGYHGIQNL